MRRCVAHSCLRHHATDACLCLQAAYCDQGLVQEVVIPLLSMQSSVLLCISTLLDGANHYSKMIELADETGKKVFESIQISLVRGIHTQSRGLQLTIVLVLLTGLRWVFENGYTRKMYASHGRDPSMDQF